MKKVLDALVKVEAVLAAAILVILIACTFFGGFFKLCVNLLSGVE